jgi:hypothetical protein
VGLVDNVLAAVAELLQDPIVRNRLTDHFFHRSLSRLRVLCVPCFLRDGRGMSRFVGQGEGVKPENVPTRASLVPPIS